MNALNTWSFYVFYAIVWVLNFIYLKYICQLAFVCQNDWTTSYKASYEDK